MVLAADQRVAVLVDCDNVSPDILEYSLRMAAQFGRVVMRRGYGNQGTLSGDWRKALVDLAFTPCLQFQYASGKNTSDLALALDAQEALFDARADTFCLVTSDSDFAYLCRKLRERGAVVCIVGEPKTPAALRNASDQFFEWARPTASVDAQKPAGFDAGPRVPSKADAATPPSAAARPKAASKQRPQFVLDAVILLASETADGKVHAGGLGTYLKRADPAFSPKAFGYAGLLEMVRAYDRLLVTQEPGGHWTVSVKASKVPPSSRKGAIGA
jgi:uncharacterized protein (TIGR00288 family)